MDAGELMRYYMAPIIGDGSEEHPYRPDLPEDVSGWVALMPSNERGAPRLEWAVCLVDGDVPDDDDNRIPFLEPGTSMSTVPTRERNTYQQRLRSTGYDITISWGRDTVEDVIDKMASFADPAWKRGGMSIGRRS